MRRAWGGRRRARARKIVSYPAAVKVLIKEAMFQLSHKSDRSVRACSLVPKLHLGTFPVPAKFHFALTLVLSCRDRQWNCLGKCVAKCNLLTRRNSIFWP